ncbi:MAG: DUF177 domain-containing protein [Kiritimatiellia bacterium]
MILDLAKLKDGGQTLEGEEPATILDIEPGGETQVISPVRYNLHAELVTGELVVRGSLSCRIAATCSRCAIRLERDIRVADFLCVREYSDLHEAIDLTENVREDIILAFPNYPVCSSGCRGLCPQCGANLNEKACSCGPPGENRAWDTLDQLTRRME